MSDIVIANQYPLVTFLSPCYNHSKFVIESLESIRKQSYPNIQHIIIDDASSDNSAEVISDWIHQHKYDCEFIVHKTNKGVSATLNEGIRLAKGDYWTPLATDDVILPERTDRFVRHLLSHPENDMVVSDTKMIDEASKEVFINSSSSFLKHYSGFNPRFSQDSFGTYPSLLFGNYIPGSIMTRTNVFNEVGMFPEHFRLEDWDTWLRISRRSPIGLIKEQLTYYRWHQGNSVAAGTHLRKDVFQTFLAQKNYCYLNGLHQLFDEAYIYYFSSFFSLKNLEFIPDLLLAAGPVTVLKAFIAKVKYSVRPR